SVRAHDGWSSSDVRPMAEPSAKQSVQSGSVAEGHPWGPSVGTIRGSRTIDLLHGISICLVSGREAGMIWVARNALAAFSGVFGNDPAGRRLLHFLPFDSPRERSPRGAAANDNEF